MVKTLQQELENASESTEVTHKRHQDEIEHLKSILVSRDEVDTDDVVDINKI